MELLKEYFMWKENDQKKEWLYVLKCENEKWYIGKSSRLIQRLEDHVNKIGAVWTTKYRPIKLMEIRTLQGEFHEDLVVKEYMKKYGMENVRGGTYSSIYLYDYQKKSIEMEMKHASNSCFKCGKQGHMAKECTENIIRCFKCDEIGHMANTCDNEEEYKQPNKKSKLMRCFVCGETGHYANECNINK